jgi:hypothetical protein
VKERWIREERNTEREEAGEICNGGEQRPESVA